MLASIALYCNVSLKLKTIIYIIYTYLCNSEHRDAQLTGLLVKRFKKTSFKGGQLTAIKAAEDRKNSLVVQPTASGKSLCFHFPGVVTGKITIVQ